MKKILKKKKRKSTAILYKQIRSTLFCELFLYMIARAILGSRRAVRRELMRLTAWLSKMYDPDIGITPSPGLSTIFPFESMPERTKKSVSTL